MVMQGELVGASLTWFISTMFHITNSQEQKSDFKIILISTVSLQVSLVCSETRFCQQTYFLGWYHSLFLIQFHETKKPKVHKENQLLCSFEHNRKCLLHPLLLQHEVYTNRPPLLSTKLQEETHCKLVRRLTCRPKASNGLLGLQTALLQVAAELHQLAFHVEAQPLEPAHSCLHYHVSIHSQETKKHGQPVFPNLL